jgi:hypothetical protein
MKQLVLILTVTMIAGSSVWSQVADPSGVETPVMQQAMIGGQPTVFPSLPMPNVMPPTTVHGSYYDAATQPLLFRVPTNYGSFTSVMVGERFTLPTVEGFLDSVFVAMPSLPLGTMRFDVWADALRQRLQTDTTKYHYPDLWTGPAAWLDTARVSAGQNDTTGFTKVVFNHKLVPQEFHVTAMPLSIGGISTMFGIVSDSKTGDSSTINPRVSRATMVVNYQGQAIPLQMHGFFANSIGQGLAPNWYMIVFLEVDLATGGTQSVALPIGPGLDQNYPNPFTTSTGHTVIPFTMAQRGFVTLEVCDAVGRVVRTLANEEVNAGSHVRIFNAKGLPAGLYTYRLISGDRQLTRSMLFVK